MNNDKTPRNDDKGNTEQASGVSQPIIQYGHQDVRRLASWLRENPMWIEHLMLTARGCGMPNWRPSRIS